MNKFSDMIPIGQVWEYFTRFIKTDVKECYKRKNPNFEKSDTTL